MKRTNKANITLEIERNSLLRNSEKLPFTQYDDKREPGCNRHYRGTLFLEYYSWKSFSPSGNVPYVVFLKEFICNLVLLHISVPLLRALAFEGVGEM
jgi:hypothetical protein